MQTCLLNITASDWKIILLKLLTIFRSKCTDPVLEACVGIAARTKAVAERILRENKEIEQNGFIFTRNENVYFKSNIAMIC